MAFTKEDISAEQVRRMLVAAKFPYIRIEPVRPPYPDVRVTLSEGKIAVETTDVHWGVGPGGSPGRGAEERAIRENRITTGFAETNPIPGIVHAIQSKCGKTYELDGDEGGFWLALMAGSTAAPRSTFIFTPFLDITKLTQASHEFLAASRFTHCYLFCELTERGPALYGWDQDNPWQQII